MASLEERLAAAREQTLEQRLEAARQDQSAPAETVQPWSFETAQSRQRSVPVGSPDYWPASMTAPSGPLPSFPRPVREFVGGGETPLTSIPGQMISNLPSSGAQFVEDTLAPIMRPVETAKAVGNLALGLVQKAIPGEQESEAVADAVGQFFLDRYGSWEAVKATMAEDPVGFAADVATVLTGGGAAAARAPGMVGQVGRIASTAGRALDPVTTAARATRGVGRTVAGPTAAYVGDILTHTGGRSLEEAYRAGRQGGRQAEAFQRAIGGAPMEEAVTEANRALANIRRNRGRLYREGMREIAADRTVLNFDRIDSALSDAVEIKRFEGVPIGRATDVADEITEAVNQWKLLDPEIYHTAEGLDALKQQIGEIRDATQYGTPDRAVADTAYQAIRREITQQAPEYANVMQNYWEASDLIKEMERTLSLNPRAQIDTSLRKLQSLMRNNANTNYGRRVMLGEMLEEAGADTLMATLAGQALEPITPRGLGRVVAGGTLAGGAGLNPALLALLPLQSPRIMGQMAYGMGAAARGVGSIPPALMSAVGPTMFQTGRLEGIE